MGCFCTLARSRLVQSDLELTVLGRLAPGRSVSLRPSDHPHHIMDLILSFVFLRGGPSPRGLPIIAESRLDWRLPPSYRGTGMGASQAPSALFCYCYCWPYSHPSLLPEPCQTATNALLPPV